MDLDFTHAKYRELCEVISKSEYTPLTVEKYLLLKDKPEPFIIIRHDVDGEPEYALKVAKLENELGDALNPILPSKDFINELQTRLRLKNPVVMEYPNYLLPIFLISTGLFFGIAIIWGLNKIYQLILSPGEE